MADLLQAARVADVATTSSDPTFQQLLKEIRHSNEQHAKHNAAFELLSSRFNNMNVSSTDANNTSRSRSPSPRRVRFTTPPRRPTSSGYDYRRSTDDRRSSDDRPPRRYYNDNNNTCPDAVWNIATIDALPQTRNASIVDVSVTSVRPADRLEEANFRGNVPSALAYSN